MKKVRQVYIEQGFYVTYEDPKTGQSYDGDVVPCSIIIRETPFLINSGKD